MEVIARIEAVGWCLRQKLEDGKVMIEGLIYIVIGWPNLANLINSIHWLGSRVTRNSPYGGNYLINQTHLMRIFTEYILCRFWLVKEYGVVPK